MTRAEVSIHDNTYDTTIQYNFMTWALATVSPGPYTPPLTLCLSADVPPGGDHTGWLGPEESLISENKKQNKYLAE